MAKPPVSVSARASEPSDFGGFEPITQERPYLKNGESQFAYFIPLMISEDRRLVAIEIVQGPDGELSPAYLNGDPAKPVHLDGGAVALMWLPSSPQVQGAIAHAIANKMVVRWRAAKKVASKKPIADERGRMAIRDVWDHECALSRKSVEPKTLAASVVMPALPAKVAEEEPF